MKAGNIDLINLNRVRGVRFKLRSEFLDLHLYDKDNAVKT